MRFITREEYAREGEEYARTGLANEPFPGRARQILIGKLESAYRGHRFAYGDDDTELVSRLRELYSSLPREDTALRQALLDMWAEAPSQFEHTLEEARHEENPFLISCLIEALAGRADDPRSLEVIRERMRREQPHYPDPVMGELWHARDERCERLLREYAAGCPDPAARNVAIRHLDSGNAENRKFAAGILSDPGASAETKFLAVCKLRVNAGEPETLDQVASLGLAADQPAAVRAAAIESIGHGLVHFDAGNDSPSRPKARQILEKCILEDADPAVRAKARETALAIWRAEANRQREKCGSILDEVTPEQAQAIIDALEGKISREEAERICAPLEEPARRHEAENQALEDRLQREERDYIDHLASLRQEPESH